MFVRDVVEMCAEMGQLTIPPERLSGQEDYHDDPVCKRLVFCCGLIFVQLNMMFGKQPAEYRVDSLFQEFQLCDFQNADGTTAPSPITQEIFCYGVLAEYFLQTQDLVRFKLWNQRYENELANIRLTKNYKPLPVGRWI